MRHFIEFLADRDQDMCLELANSMDEGNLRSLGMTALAALGLSTPAAGAEIAPSAAHHINQPSINRIAAKEAGLGSLPPRSAKGIDYQVIMKPDGSQWHERLDDMGHKVSTRFDGAKTQDTLGRLGPGHHYNTRTNEIEDQSGNRFHPHTGKPLGDRGVKLVPTR